MKSKRAQRLATCYCHVRQYVTGFIWQIFMKFIYSDSAALFQFLYSTSQRSGGGGHSSVPKAGFGKNNRCWVRPSGCWRTTPWLTLPIQCSKPKLKVRKDDPYTLKQGRKQEMSTARLPFTTSVIKSTTNGKLKTAAVTRSCLGWR
jgi:hypothetical protein